MGAAESKKGLQRHESLLLLGSSALRGVCVVRRCAESSGKVVTIVRILAAAYGDLVPGVNQRQAAHRGQDGEGKLEHLRRDGGIRKAGRIVVVEKGNQAFGVRIQVVETQDLSQPGHGGVPVEDVAQGEISGEIERSI